MAATEHSIYASYREALLEHLFAGEVMRHLWLSGVHRMEVLKPQVDDGGYDLVLEAGGITRHVQLKSSHQGSSTAQVNVNLRLMEKPSGCVVWTIFHPDTLHLGPFLWFGGAPGKKLPDVRDFKVAKHAKGNAEGVKLRRPNIRVVPLRHFERVGSIPELIEKLFGSLRAGTGSDRGEGDAAEAWDRQLEADVGAGRLDRYAEEALSDLRAGRTTDL